MVSHWERYEMTYIQHFTRAMSMSIALFIHAFIPSLFPTYASSKMNRIDRK
jgi:hypothetical protein